MLVAAENGRVSARGARSADADDGIPRRHRDGPGRTEPVAPVSVSTSTVAVPHPLRPQPGRAQSSEPILVPNLRIELADFPYPYIVLSTRAGQLGRHCLGYGSTDRHEITLSTSDLQEADRGATGQPQEPRCFTGNSVPISDEPIQTQPYKEKKTTIPGVLRRRLRSSVALPATWTTRFPGPVLSRRLVAPAKRSVRRGARSAAQLRDSKEGPPRWARAEPNRVAPVIFGPLPVRATNPLRTPAPRAQSSEPILSPSYGSNLRLPLPYIVLQNPEAVLTLGPAADRGTDRQKITLSPSEIFKGPQTHRAPQKPGAFTGTASPISGRADSRVHETLQRKTTLPRGLRRRFPSSVFRYRT
ncbi:hypothetical protein HNY73_011706 [Argiope bruennichi]|uniref:Uncharacterized protein n=1 Tax=Argiope bruennichi TaxID=94029 RepID=A0A8T0EYY8_ARGBR|nr:hypothetical protein HNY73_011706 [Argiope bruennichi]